MAERDCDAILGLPGSVGAGQRDATLPALGEPVVRYSEYMQSNGGQFDELFEDHFSHGGVDAVRATCWRIAASRGLR
jgi:hypothetical protein